MGKLEGVHPQMVETVVKAIAKTTVDFGVTYGVRTESEQKKLFDSGRSQTMKSKHLIQEDNYSHAVDLVAYDGSNVVWELNVYDEVADAMAEASREVGCRLRWGAAWHIDDIGAYGGSMEDAMNEYIDLRRSQGRRPFIDAPHFELRQ